MKHKHKQLEPEIYKVQFVLLPDQLLADRLELAFCMFNDLLTRNVASKDLFRLKQTNKYMYSCDDHALRYALQHRKRDRIRLDQSIRVTDTYIKLGSFGRCDYTGRVNQPCQVSKSDLCKRIIIRKAESCFTATVIMKTPVPELTKKQPPPQWKPKHSKKCYQELKDIFAESCNRRSIWKPNWTPRVDEHTTHEELDNG